MSTSSLVRAAVLALIAALASCTLAPDHCLRMSDCADGTTCVDGRCSGSPPASETLSSAADASSLPPVDTSSTSVATPRDAALMDASDASDPSDASTDASTDGALTDAASD